jgi:hypothetical protein
MNNKLLWALVAAALLAGCQEPNAAPPAPSSPAVPEVAHTEAPSSADEGVTDGELRPEVLEGVEVARATEASYCNIESVEGGAFAASALPVTPGQKIRGWLGHEAGGAVQSPVLVMLGGKGEIAGIALQLSMSREDVVNAYGGRADLLESGFEAVLPAMQAGSYKLLLHYKINGQAYRCENGRQIKY